RRHTRFSRDWSSDVCSSDLYFLIWYANIPEETFWYRERWEHGWSGPALAMIFATFVLPFLILLAREPKRRVGTLVAAAMIVILEIGRASCRERVAVLAVPVS